jgi:hypothetical protein
MVEKGINSIKNILKCLFFMQKQHLLAHKTAKIGADQTQTERRRSADTTHVLR